MERRRCKNGTQGEEKERNNKGEEDMREARRKTEGLVLCLNSSEPSGGEMCDVQACE